MRSGNLHLQQMTNLPRHVLLYLLSVLIFSGSATAVEVTKTTEDINFFVDIPCANEGTGESVWFTAVLTRIWKDGVNTHGHLTNAWGVGQTTGDQYVGSGSPSNVTPFVEEGEFLYHLSWTGLGRTAAKFSITAIGGVGEEPTRTLQLSCHI